MTDDANVELDEMLAIYNATKIEGLKGPNFSSSTAGSITSCIIRDLIFFFGEDTNAKHSKDSIDVIYQEFQSHYQDGIKLLCKKNPSSSPYEMENNQKTYNYNIQ